MKYINICILLIFVSNACDNKCKPVYYKSGELKECCTYFKNNNIYICTGYYKNGNIKYNKRFRDDLLDGVKLDYYKEGIIKSYQEYKNGLPHGIVLSYYKNGSLDITGSFLNGLREGKAIEYSTLGEPNREYFYENDTQKLFVRYYEHELDKSILKKYYKVINKEAFPVGHLLYDSTMTKINPDLSNYYEIISEDSVSERSSFLVKIKIYPPDSSYAITFKGKKDTFLVKGNEYIYSTTDYTKGLYRLRGMIFEVRKNPDGKVKYEELYPIYNNYYIEFE